MKFRYIIQSIITAAVLLAALSSCLEDSAFDEATSGKEIVVKYAEDEGDEAATRGVVISGKSDLNGSRFGFYGFHKPTATPVTYINTHALVNSNNTVTIGDTKYWPPNRNTNMKFYSWYPYEGTYKPTADFTVKDKMTLSHTIQPVCANQVDVMAAVSQPAWGTAVPVYFYHALTKVTFSFKKETDKVPNATITRVEIRKVPKTGSITLTDIPAKTPTYPKFVWGTSATENVYFEPNIEITGTGVQQLSDAFLLFPMDTFTNDMELAITMSGGVPTRTIKLTDIVKKTAHAWRSGEHINYRVTISNQSYEIQAVPMPWIEDDNDLDITPRYLNISQDEVSMTHMNGVRISFSTNMPYVWMRGHCIVNGADYKNTYDWFNEIAPYDWNDNDPVRLRLDPDTGKGYIDLVAQGVKKGTYQIVLTMYAGKTKETAKALTRNITVNLNATFTHDIYNNYFDPVGAFFRFDQSGERIISGFSNYSISNGVPNGGAVNGIWDKAAKWTAEVVSGDFIVLNTSPSFDPRVGYADPGNAEDYRVTPTDEPIWGRGRTYFRIGTTGPVTDPVGTRKPRYGKVRVNCYDESGTSVVYSYDIHVRQGEDADWVMRPTGDPLKNVTGSQIQATRPLAKQISPYNLTTMEYRQDKDYAAHSIVMNSAYFNTNGTTDVENKYFTEYPTQAGVHVGWMYFKDSYYIGSPKLATASYLQRAYHPVKDPLDIQWFAETLVIAGTPTDVFWGNDSNATKNETCPPGYRRPTDGTTTDYTSMASQAAAVNSEIRQSLFEYIPYGHRYNGDTTNPAEANMNYKYGIYSDGFFDRRLRDESKVWKGSIASENNAHVAYAGTVFYNNTTHASIFFPAAGRREKGGDGTVPSTPGEFRYNKSTGFYWTSSMGPRRSEKDPSDGVTRNAYRGSALNIHYPQSGYPPAYMTGDNTNMGCSVRCVKQ